MRMICYYLYFRIEILVSIDVVIHTVFIVYSVNDAIDVLDTHNPKIFNVLILEKALL